MSAARLALALRVVVFVVMCTPGVTMAQTPGAVRVTDGPARIQRYYRSPLTELMMQVETGTTLEVLDEENGWYWVIVPPNAHGTRKAGWIRARHVEPVVIGRASRAPEPAASAANGADAAAAASAAIEEDRVSITPRGGEAAARAASYAFGDIHFDRDRHTLRSEDMTQLQTAVAALKADPALSVNLEGYTCNLGAPAYNLALGARRANAVKEYLVSQGIGAERLHTVSLGEDHSKHDNSREETRRLNRRVALVPNAKP